MFKDLSNIDRSSPVVIFGAGLSGRVVSFALNKNKIKPSFFIDSDVSKHDQKFYGIECISIEKLREKNFKNVNIFIAHNYIDEAVKICLMNSFNNIFTSVEILDSIDLSEENEYTKLYPEFTSLKLKRNFEIHKYSVLKYLSSSDTQKNDKLIMKHLDVVITERCSMKCKDCANLMQYYEKPMNSDLDQLSKSLDRLMNNVDRLYEFRILGGDPFMNKEMHKIVNKTVGYDNVDSIVVYTNATILPKNENLYCLKNPKVRLQITNYGANLSRKHDLLIDILNKNDIKYVTEKVIEWDDIGKIKYERKTHEKLQKTFDDCCAKDIFTLLDGIIYKCPVSAHGTKLKAIPFDKKYDGINLLDDYKNGELKLALKDFYTNKNYVTACSYCKGRGYGFGSIKAAIQTKEPIKYEKIK